MWGSIRARICRNENPIDTDGSQEQTQRVILYPLFVYRRVLIVSVQDGFPKTRVTFSGKYDSSAVGVLMSNPVRIFKNTM